MDLSKFDVKSAAKSGAFLHLRNPFNQSLIYDIQPPKTEGGEEIKTKVGMLLMGRDSPAVMAKSREIDRRRLKGEEITDEQASCEMLATALISWTGIALPGETEEAAASYDNAMVIFTSPETSWVSEQASMFSAVRINFMGNVSEN